MILLPTKLTSAIQSEFSAKYPLLQLKFYSSSHNEYEGSPMKDEVVENKQLKELNDSIKEGEIDISAEATPHMLESEFENKFGLHVQVFRKSGDVWLQTSKTDFWPLGQHQLKAEETL